MGSEKVIENAHEDKLLILLQEPVIRKRRSNYKSG
jgi:hypothetical protein